MTTFFVVWFTIGLAVWCYYVIWIWKRWTPRDRLLIIHIVGAFLGLFLIGPVGLLSVDRWKREFLESV